MEMSKDKLIEQMYKAKREFIILGLTGRTGSGCTTVSKILQKENVEMLNLKNPKYYEYNDAEERKYKVCYEFIHHDHNWQPFKVLEISSIILYFALEKGSDEIIKWLEEMCEERLIQIPEIDNIKKEFTDNLKEIFTRIKELPFEKMDINNETKRKEYYEYFLSGVKETKKIFRNIFENYICYQIISSKKEGKIRIKHNFYVYFMQMLGNNLRKTGQPFDSEKFNDDYNCFIKQIVKIINFIKAVNEKDYDGKKVGTRICIDAIRNPYEAHYLHDYYRSFFLMAINTDDKDRRLRLENYSQRELENLDYVEYPLKFNGPEERFYHQNIQECLEITDIHIYNPNEPNNQYDDLIKQLIKYISLILHPGLVTPSHIERCMQLAYNAKYNSGCLSRQVGAIVTRSDYSVQSVGWNDVPKGQITCGLRDIFNFIQNKDDTSYSEFELGSKEFKCAIENICSKVKDKMNGLPYPYCFKDIYNGIKGDKNQVYTRALHAEENAFLQVSKYGGSQIQGGYLFVTASPCELCSKKSFQLGIKKIYYIDPYPGISKKHIISYNTEDKPEMILFSGAIGYAYMELYSQRIAYKDELELITGVKPKEVLKENKTFEEPNYNDLSLSEVKVKLKFDSNLENAEYQEDIKGKVLCNNIENIRRGIRWTGSRVKLITGDLNEKAKYQIKELYNEGEYHYFSVDFKNKIEKEDKFNYTVNVSLSNEGQMMEHHYAYFIKYKTEELNISLTLPKKTKKVVMKEYADKSMKILIGEIELQSKDVDETLSEYNYEKKEPIVNYMYVIEWE
ncbi:MAG: hypothetical protein ACLUVC_03620 [Longibaculum sp.]